MTTKTLAQIRDMNRAGHSDAEICRKLGLPYATVNCWRKKSGLPRNKVTRMKQYAFYDRKTSKFLYEGNVLECAEYLGLSAKSMPNTIFRSRNGLGKYEVYEVERW